VVMLRSNFSSANHNKLSNGELAEMLRILPEPKHPRFVRRDTAASDIDVYRDSAKHQMSET